MRNNKLLWPRLRKLFNKEEDIDKTGKVHFMRYFISFGAPLDMTSKPSLEDDTKSGVRYRDYTDRTKDQMKYVDDFQSDIL